MRMVEMRMVGHAFLPPGVGGGASSRRLAFGKTRRWGGRAATSSVARMLAVATTPLRPYGAPPPQGGRKTATSVLRP